MGISKDQILKEQGALKDFATAIQDILDGLGAGSGQSSATAASAAGVLTHVTDAGGVVGGQVLIAGNPVTAMPEVDKLNIAYQGHHAGTQGNVTALISTLQLMQASATALEKIYDNAQQTESLSADQVKQAFAAASAQLDPAAPTLPVTGAPPTGPTA